MKKQLIILCLLVLALCSSCYEVVEGCLDTNAVNFAIDADRECEDCCTYPTLSIRFVNIWDDGDTSFTFNYNAIYEDAGGQAFSFNRITYYLKDFALIEDSGNQVFTVDTVLVSKSR